MQLSFDIRAFLQQDWQRRPRLFRQAFSHFEDAIEPEILAGLALEEGIDARVISHQANRWQVTHGPFEDYERFGEHDWTLLVQSVNEWVPAVAALLEPFRFLPDWRLDDVMVSFATEGGGVGPHLDQYDVFIIQGQGRRHWRVGARGDYPEHRPHPDLKQLVTPQFETLIDAELAPGDMLYIPAGCPHEGIGLEPSLNYSIGFRAPTQVELLSQVVDALIDVDALGARYRDPEDLQIQSSYQVDATQLQAIRNFASQALSQTALDDALLRVLSQSKRPLPQPELPLTATQLQQLDAREVSLVRTPGARLLLSPTGAAYCAGEYLNVGAKATATLHMLAASTTELALEELLLAEPEVADLVSQLLALGAWYLLLDDDDAADED